MTVPEHEAPAEVTTPAPPPAVDAARASFYRRPLPEGQVAFSSPEGRVLFREALAAGHMEGYFALSEQFHTQAEPAFCGLGTLVVVLNALEIDPGRIWKGPWRWYGEQLLDCCLPLEQVQQKGITIDELACLARCNGATATTFRASSGGGGEGDGGEPHEGGVDAAGGVSALRAAVRASTAAARGSVLVASYARSALGQTGSGHFSPVAGYHPARDLVLILDVARFKYPPHWVPLRSLWKAMTGIDVATGQARGWMVLDRGHQRAVPLYFRLLAVEGLAHLVSSLLDEAPALLATVPTDSAQELIAGWVRAVEAGLAGPVRQAFQPMLDSADNLPLEHREMIRTVVAQLQATSAFRCVRGARVGAPPGQVPDDVLATLLLALPETALSRLPTRAAAALATLRDPSEMGPALADEITALRDQMTSLRQWSCGRSRAVTPPASDERIRG